MTSNFSGVASPGIKGLSAPGYSPVDKKLTQPGAGAVGGAANPELAGWYEQAYAYYNAVMSGAEARPDPAAWQGFMEQMQWASGQLGYGAPGGQAWNPGMMGPGGPMGPQGPQSNQFGGMTGTMDNWVYTDEKASIGFTGNGTHDIWSNDTTINVAPTSANVVVENTTDTRSSPGGPVVKITVTDPATGTQAVYFVHNFDPTKDKIKINTPDSASQVVNNTGDTTAITTGKFTPGGTAGAGQKDASIEGVPQDDGTILYEPEFAGGTIDFWANPGESQTHVVYSDANISVKPSDNVNASMDTNGELVIKVTHRDGTTDTYKIEKGYKANVNVNEEYITFGTPPSDTMPSDLAERLTLNGGVTADGSSGAASADAIVSALEEATGRNDGQVMSALTAAGYSYADMAAFKKAITDGDFPGESPTGKLVDFLRRLDPDLAADCNDLMALASVTDSSKDSQKKTLTENIQERLVELLGKMYPNAIFTPGPIVSGNFGGAIQFNGTDFNWSLTKTGENAGELDGSME